MCSDEKQLEGGFGEHGRHGCPHVRKHGNRSDCLLPSHCKSGGEESRLSLARWTRSRRFKHALLRTSTLHTLPYHERTRLELETPKRESITIITTCHKNTKYQVMIVSDTLAKMNKIQRKFRRGRQFQPISATQCPRASNSTVQESWRLSHTLR